MKRILKAAAAAIAVAAAMSSCIDSNYDVSNIDATIGLGGDTLLLPTGNSTENIYLDEFIDIDSCNFIHIDSKTGDYILSATSSNNSIEFRGTPSFLKDNDIRVNLYSPVININFTSSGGDRLDGLFRSVDGNGNTMATVHIPSTPLPRGNSVVSIRTDDRKAKGDTITIKASDLQVLLHHIPDHITFSNSRAIIETFSINTPLSFGKNAYITYKDSMDGWHDTLRKLSFRNTDDGRPDGRIVLTADFCNKVPLYLKVTAYGIGTAGDSISTERLRVSVDRDIMASADGIQAAVTPLKITLEPLDNTVFRELDGLRLVFRTSTDNPAGPEVTGVIINARHQTVTATNITARIIGKVVGNFN